MNTLKVLFTLLIVTSFMMASCGGPQTSEQTAAEPTEQAATADDHEDHDHSGHEDAAGESHDGPEYTSAYICPMHCPGSGSDQPGKCPACKMDYVANPDAATEEAAPNEGETETPAEGSPENNG